MAIAALILLALAGCGGGDFGPTPRTFDTGVNLPPQVVQGWTVTRIRVDVSPKLTVSTDPEVRFPGTDLDWWEDPPGDRRAQIAELLREAVARAVAGLHGNTPVTVTLKVNWFHALTPVARRSGSYGWHDINFDLTVTDASGKVLAAEKSIDADLKAFQGEAAKRAEANGLTQKVRIQRRVEDVLRRWFGLI